MYSENLKKVRKALGMTIARLSKEIDVSANTISAYERGLRCPSLDFGTRLYERLNINLNWFNTGHGEMFNKICENSKAIIKNTNACKGVKNWGDRLNKILVENCITSYEFSKLTGIKESRIDRFILESTEPTFSEITTIKSNVDVSVDWLLYGENIACKNDKKADNQQRLKFTDDEILKLKEILKERK